MLLQPMSCADRYSPSELLHGRRIRSILPSINDEVDINAAKAARQHTDLLVKNKKQTGKPLPSLSLRDLCYRIKLDGKKETLVSNPCEVIQIRRHGESYYIKDLVTNRIYLRNRKYIKKSESYKNELHKIEAMEILANKNIKHKIVDGKLSTEDTTPPTGCLRTKNSPSSSKRVQFDSTMYICRVELKKIRALRKESK